MYYCMDIIQLKKKRRFALCLEKSEFVDVFIMKLNSRERVFLKAIKTTNIKLNKIYKESLFY